MCYYKLITCETDMFCNFLVCNFQETCEPVMCCYKLITCKFKWFGLQGRVEAFINRVSNQYLN